MNKADIKVGQEIGFREKNGRITSWNVVRVDLAHNRVALVSSTYPKTRWVSASRTEML